MFILPHCAKNGMAKCLQTLAQSDIETIMRASFWTSVNVMSCNGCLTFFKRNNLKLVQVIASVFNATTGFI